MPQPADGMPFVQSRKLGAVASRRPAASAERWEIFGFQLRGSRPSILGIRGPNQESCYQEQSQHLERQEPERNLGRKQAGHSQDWNVKTKAIKELETLH